MPRAPRTLALIVAALFVLGGLALGVTHGAGPAWPLVIVGVAILLSAGLERRYRRGDDHSPAADDNWAPTGEVFRDEESGQWLRVWQHRRNGARRYLPCTPETPAG